MPSLPRLLPFALVLFCKIATAGTNSSIPLPQAEGLRLHKAPWKLDVPLLGQPSKKMTVRQLPPPERRGSFEAWMLAEIENTAYQGLLKLAQINAPLAEGVAERLLQLHVVFRYDPTSDQMGLVARAVRYSNQIGPFLFGPPVIHLGFAALADFYEGFDPQWVKDHAEQEGLWNRRPVKSELELQARRRETIFHELLHLADLPVTSDLHSKAKRTENRQDANGFYQTEIDPVYACTAQAIESPEGYTGLLRGVPNSYRACLTCAELVVLRTGDIISAPNSDWNPEGKFECLRRFL